MKKQSPDKFLSKSLIKIALIRIKNLEHETISDDTSFQIIENCYEAIREIIDALMSIKGYKSYSHEAGIEFLKAFLYPVIDTQTINKIDRYKALRNDIKYRGILTTKKEAEICFKETNDIIAKLLALAKKENILE